LIETIFRAFVVYQPFLWMWVLEDERFEGIDDVNIDSWFGVSVFVFIVLVSIFQFSIAFYSTELLIVYALLVWAGAWVCKHTFNYSFKDAVAISFLITYLNSWYWEGILHLWAIMENGMNANQLVQLGHLIPGLYFLKQWEFDVQESANCLMKGWAIAGLITFTRKARLWKYLPIVFTDWNVAFIDHGLMNVNRVICFYYLLKAIVRWGMPKQDLEPELPHYRTRF
jgi:hypothetical protein